MWEKNIQFSFDFEKKKKKKEFARGKNAKNLKGICVPCSTGLFVISNNIRDPMQNEDGREMILLANIIALTKPPPLSRRTGLYCIREINKISKITL